MILAQVWEAIFAQTPTGHSIFSRAFQAQILLGCEASVLQLSKLVHNLHIHAKMGALRTKFKVKIYHGDWDQIFHTFKKWTFWHPLTQKLVKMVMPQYIEGGFMLFSKIHDSHSTTSDQISWLHSSALLPCCSHWTQPIQAGTEPKEINDWEQKLNMHIMWIICICIIHW